MSGDSVDLILASASPRRHELIELLGIPFRIVASHYDEPSAPAHPVSLPHLVMELAANKAREVSDRIGAAWVLGADTLVSLDDGIGIPLGKPADSVDAHRMLSLLARRDHFVYTGIALIPPRLPQEPARPVTAVAKTRVWFRELSSEAIDDYVATGEPLDKAGAYGAQGYAAPFIERYEGDFNNVVGLPLCEVGRLMEHCGLDWLKLRRQNIRDKHISKSGQSPAI